MKIIIDTREQKPLKFPGHEIEYRKLDEGDYASEFTEDKIVIERKSVEDFYGSLIQGHQRFKREILRAIEKKKEIYIFIEGSKRDVLNYCKTRNFKEETMCKIILTMELRYNLQIVECKNRKQMSEKIVQLCTEMEKWSTQQKRVKENI